jgi:hypothetical protein
MKIQDAAMVLEEQPGKVRFNCFLWNPVLIPTPPPQKKKGGALKIYEI